MGVEAGGVVLGGMDCSLLWVLGGGGDVVVCCVLCCVCVVCCVLYCVCVVCLLCVVCVCSRVCVFVSLSLLYPNLYNLLLPGGASCFG